MLRHIVICYIVIQVNYAARGFARALARSLARSSLPEGGFWDEVLLPSADKVSPAVDVVVKFIAIRFFAVICLSFIIYSYLIRRLNWISTLTLYCFEIW